MPKIPKLKLVHTNIWEPTQVCSIGDSYYFVTFIDDVTKKQWICFLKHNSDVFDVFKKWRDLVENETYN